MALSKIDLHSIRHAVGFYDRETGDDYCPECLDLESPWVKEPVPIFDTDLWTGECCECGTEIVTQAVKNREGGA